MSHVVGVDLTVTNLEDLKVAADQCGLAFQENKQKFNWFGKYMGDYSRADAAYNNVGIKPEDYGKCNHALSVKGNPTAYEIGVVRNQDGTYKLLYDFWGGHGRALQDRVGANADKLKNEYGIAAAMRASQQKGHLVRRENLENGRVKVTVGVR